MRNLHLGVIDGYIASAVETRLRAQDVDRAQGKVGAGGSAGQGPVDSQLCSVMLSRRVESWEVS